MVLIIDSGATKCEYFLLSPGEEEGLCYVSSGMNVNYVSDEDVEKNITSFLHEVSGVDVTNIQHLFFYGAGCGNEGSVKRIETLLQRFFPQTRIAVFSDLIGACHALCGKSRGWVGILGTGSSSCLYDGEKVIEASPSLGYMLGDEGSGTSLGKSFLKAYLSNTLPLEVVKEFEKEFQLDQKRVMERVYRTALPNRFMASLVPFMRKNHDHPSVAMLAVTSFRYFIEKEMAFYRDKISGLPLNLAGSVAFHYREEIREIAEEYRITLGEVIASPMEGLIRYHKQIG